MRSQKRVEWVIGSPQTDRGLSEAPRLKSLSILRIDRLNLLRDGTIATAGRASRFWRREGCWLLAAPTPVCLSGGVPCFRGTASETICCQHPAKACACAAHMLSRGGDGITISTAARESMAHPLGRRKRCARSRTPKSAGTPACLSIGLVSRRQLCDAPAFPTQGAQGLCQIKGGAHVRPEHTAPIRN